jgi:hypothetical protein
MSALITSAFVVILPCGKPGQILSVPCLSRFACSTDTSFYGTTWSIVTLQHESRHRDRSQIVRLICLRKAFLMLNGIEAMRATTADLSVKVQLPEDGQVLLSVAGSGVGLSPVPF